MISEVIKSLRSIMESSKCEYLLVTNPHNFIYLTKLPLSRLPQPAGYYLLITESVSYALTPLLEYWRVNELLGKYYEVVPTSRYEVPIPSLKNKVIKDLVKFVIEKVGTNASLCTDCTDVSTYQRLSKYVKLIDVSKDLLNLRSVKRRDEIELIRHALSITEECLNRVMESLTVGLKELEVVGLIEGLMRSLGADGPAFSTIVASGSNTSYPHAVPTTKELSKGDIVIIDLGASYGNYSSDTTRTLTIGSASEDVRKVIEAVKEALLTATDYVRDGVEAKEVDAKAREVLRRYGLDSYFIHGLGHGVGIEVHEPPYLSPSSSDVLKEGMVVTIEPGVYIPGKLGVRIENMVLVKKSGCEVLNKLPLILTT